MTLRNNERKLEKLAILAKDIIGGDYFRNLGGHIYFV